MKKDWKEYPPNKMFYKEAVKHYQKIYNDIGINILEYPPYKDGKITYEVHLQIPSEKSITGITANISLFTYREKDFDKFEADAKKIIDRLV